MRISDWSSDVCSSVLNLTDIFFWHPSLKPVIWQLSREGHHRSRPSGIALAPPPPRALGGRLHHRSEIPMTRDEMMGLKPRHYSAQDERRCLHRSSGVCRHAARGHGGDRPQDPGDGCRSEEHTSELQSLMRISYAVFC